MLSDLCNEFQGVLSRCGVLQVVVASAVVASRVAACLLRQGMLCLAMSTHVTTIHQRVDIIIRAALQLGGRACIVLLSMREVCGGVGEKVRSKLRGGGAKPACLRCLPRHVSVRHHDPLTC